MIGDVPRGAPIRCRLGFHKPLPGAGLYIYTCARCAGAYWQRKDYSGAVRAADRAIDRGDFDGAERIRARTLGEPERKGVW